jgi:hypothetical protein
MAAATETRARVYPPPLSTGMALLDSMDREHKLTPMAAEAFRLLSSNPVKLQKWVDEGDAEHWAAAYTAALLYAKNALLSWPGPRFHAIPAIIGETYPAEAGAAFLEWVWQKHPYPHTRATVAENPDLVGHATKTKFGKANIPVLQWLFNNGLLTLAQCREIRLLVQAFAQADRALAEWLGTVGITKEDYKIHLIPILRELRPACVQLLDKQAFTAEDLARITPSTLSVIFRAGNVTALEWVDRHMPEFEWVDRHIPKPMYSECWQTEVPYYKVTALFLCRKSLALGRVVLPEYWLADLCGESRPEARAVLRMLPQKKALEFSRQRKNIIGTARHNKDKSLLKWLYEIGRTRGEFRVAKAEDYWIEFDTYRKKQSLVALIAAGRRKKLRLPSEVWEELIIPLLT